MNRLSPIDAAFLRMESKRTPMHVGAMMTFKLPADAPADFCQQLVQQMRSKPFMPDPFSSRLARGRFGRRLPAWEDSEVDMEYHLRHSALPFPGGEKELGVLVARMHSHPLDLSRPLWECHVIEGLEGNRFALYFKAHHCAIDGVGAMRMVQNWLSKDPNDRSGVGPWTVLERKRTTRAKPTLRERVSTPARSAAAQLRGLQDLVRNLAAMVQGDDSSVRLALKVPRSLFNQRISQQRRLGTQILSLKRLRAVAEAERVTVNDVLLAVVGGAFRRYLQAQDALPERGLIASVPMGLARSDDTAGTAAVGFITPLGTELEDPAERLRWIHRVTARGKHDLSSMPAAAQSQFALLGIAPLLIGQVTGVLPKLPPLFNCVVSNVVLSKDPMYLMGAELEAMYPVSFLFDGYALNVTLVGYRDGVAVGFLGCRDAIPSLQKLAIHSGEALAELEAAVGVAAPSPAAKPKPRPRKAPRKRAS
jgi:diacylglycerol O-acyltransferase